MLDVTIPDRDSLFLRTLTECRDLYVSSATLCARDFPQLLPTGKGKRTLSAEEFIALMDDLHRALVLKVYFAVAEADRKWSSHERLLAEALFDHLWGRRLTGDELRAAARQLSADAVKLKWYSIVRPFDQIAPLRDRIGTLETLVMRLANLVARSDGELNASEAAVIKNIHEELRHHLRAIPIDEPNEHEKIGAIGQQAIETLKAEGADINSVMAQGGGGKGAGGGSKSSSPPPSSLRRPPSAASLEEALAELDALVGLERVKHEVRTLTNFLKLQRRREEAGLPDTDISLHMVFTGNPGTGKTSVARILGKIFGAMGILKKGHLVETDRSGLVAEYAGQTGPRTNAKINEALDGVLFVDEAYSLAVRDAQDPYGEEAVQALLKRAEDDRGRLVVILAGYPEEMDELLKSNPGLSSRFNRVLEFDDYSPLELARIFAFLCAKNHYKLAAATRARLMLGVTELYRRRDNHFGNGRAVRNLFEQAVRRMANRIADLPKLDPEQLMLLEGDDIEFARLPADWLAAYEAREPKFRVKCLSCGFTSDAPGKFLGQKVRCPKCKQDFLAEWGEVA
jgi:AAA lid domain/ATPase family associated with various cellular activities (AAA)